MNRLYRRCNGEVDKFRLVIGRSIKSDYERKPTAKPWSKAKTQCTGPRPQSKLKKRKFLGAKIWLMFRFWLWKRCIRDFGVQALKEQKFTRKHFNPKCSKWVQPVDLHYGNHIKRMSYKEIRVVVEQQYQVYFNRFKKLQLSFLLLLRNDWKLEPSKSSQPANYAF